MFRFRLLFLEYVSTNIGTLSLPLWEILINYSAFGRPAKSDSMDGRPCLPLSLKKIASAYRPL
jgi:hypothetical protein